MSASWASGCELTPGATRVCELGTFGCTHQHHVYPPWDEGQVASLNSYQASKYVHPFTCGGGCRQDLVAHADGWRCPTCAYRQNWAHDFMAVWPRPNEV